MHRVYIHRLPIRHNFNTGNKMREFRSTRQDQNGIYFSLFIIDFICFWYFDFIFYNYIDLPKDEDARFMDKRTKLRVYIYIFICFFPFFPVYMFLFFSWSLSLSLSRAHIQNTYRKKKLFQLCVLRTRTLNSKYFSMDLIILCCLMLNIHYWHMAIFAQRLTTHSGVIELQHFSFYSRLFNFYLMFLNNNRNQQKFYFICKWKIVWLKLIHTKNILQNVILHQVYLKYKHKIWINTYFC